MDLLEQYKQQHPEAFREKPQWQPSSEYGFFIRLVMRLSGGRIRDASSASYILLAVAGCVAMLAIAIGFIHSDRNRAPEIPPSPFEPPKSLR